jgi:hypothetical protein
MDRYGLHANNQNGIETSFIHDVAAGADIF